MRNGVVAHVSCWLGSGLGPPLFALQRWRRLGVIVLYHRVSPDLDPSYPPIPPPIFDRQVELIKNHFRVLRLTELLDRLDQGKSLAGCCALTFDDGYRDFLSHAYPILKRQAVPATHFLVTDCLTSGRPTWNLRLNRLLHDVGSPSAEELPSRDMKNYLGRMPATERDDWLLNLEANTSGLPAEPEMLSPEDLRVFDPELVDWGSHTVSHANLDGCDGPALRSELTESRERLEGILGSPIQLLSYPNGRSSPDVHREAAASGYSWALAVGQKALARDSPRYALPRFDVGASSLNIKSASALALEVGGFFQAVRDARSALTAKRRPS